MEVELHFGDTSQMLQVCLGDVYPFHQSRQPQNGGPMEGNCSGAGFTVCPLCGKDFFCDVEIKNGRLTGCRPSITETPYGADRWIESPARCNTCGGTDTAHGEFDNFTLGQFTCGTCNSSVTTNLTNDGYYLYGPQRFRRKGPSPG